MSDLNIGKTAQSIANGMQNQEMSKSQVTELKESGTNTVADIQTSQDLEKARRQGEKIPISKELLIRSIDRALKEIEGPQTELQFMVHQKTHRITVKVMDKKTGDVIREIPPENTLAFLSRMWSMTGLIVDEKY